MAVEKMARREKTNLPTGSIAPELPVEYGLYASAYIMLDSEREYLRPIPWTAIAAYCGFYDLDPDQADYMFAILRRVDNAILVEREEKARKDRSDAQPTGPRQRYGRTGR